MDIALGRTNRDLIILVEKEYLDTTSKRFYTRLIKALNKQYPSAKVIKYLVKQDLKEVVYFVDDKPISKTQLSKFVNSYPRFIDFIQTGRAFYKDNPFKSGITIVRLSGNNAKLFGYNRFMTTMLNKKSLITSSYLKQVNNLKVDRLNIDIPANTYFYSGFGDINVYNPKSSFRILPIDTLTGFLKNPNNIPMKRSNILISGVIEKHGYVEDINKKLNLSGKIHLSIKKNRINSLSVNSRQVNLDKNHEIVHLTFGSNPFAVGNRLQITDYERNQNHLCIGIETDNKSHIDICLNTHPIKYTSLIIYWLKQEIMQLIS